MSGNPTGIPQESDILWTICTNVQREAQDNFAGNAGNAEKMAMSIWSSGWQAKHGASCPNGAVVSNSKAFDPFGFGKLFRTLVETETNPANRPLDS
jgi:hypothetical protein